MTDLNRREVIKAGGASVASLGAVALPVAASADPVLALRDKRDALFEKAAELDIRLTETLKALPEWARRPTVEITTPSGQRGVVASARHIRELFSRENEKHPLWPSEAWPEDLKAAFEKVKHIRYPKPPGPKDEEPLREYHRLHDAHMIKISVEVNSARDEALEKLESRKREAYDALTASGYVSLDNEMDAVNDEAFGYERELCRTVATSREGLLFQIDLLGEYQEAHEVDEGHRALLASISAGVRRLA